MRTRISLLLAMEVCALLVLGALQLLRLLGFLAVGLLPRLLNLLLTTDTTYVLYGFHYYVAQH